MWKLFRDYWFLGIVFIIAIVMWYFYVRWVAPVGVTLHEYQRFSSWGVAGQFGDSFGALTCLFSALGFAGVLFTIYRDQRNREENRELEVYQSLLAASETLLVGFPPSKDSAVIERERQNLFRRLRYFSSEIEQIVTSRNLTDAQIIKAFVKDLGFDRKDVAENVREIRIRLLMNFVDSNKKLRAFTKNKEVKTFLEALFANELHTGKVDAQGYALYGSMAFTSGPKGPGWIRTRKVFQEDCKDLAGTYEQFVTLREEMSDLEKYIKRGQTKSEELRAH